MAESIAIIDKTRMVRLQAFSGQGISRVGLRLVSSAVTGRRRVTLKGVVFTVFLEMLEEQYSADTVDAVLDGADLPSGGVYTAVGTYSHDEMVALVGALSKHVSVSVPDLLRGYGEYLFGYFVKAYPDLVNAHADAFALLTGVEKVIHAQVRKLYPDAELPRFEIERPGDDTLVMNYHSARHFDDLCEGLIKGCIAHFSENIALSRKTLGRGDERVEQFVLTNNRR